MQFLISIIFAGLVFSNELAITNQIPSNFVQNQVIQKNIIDETERFEQNYPFNSKGKISVSNINGSITVEAWDKNEIKLEYIKTADSKEKLEEVNVKIDASQDFFRVETDYDSWRRRNGNNWGKNNGNLKVEFRLMVPKSAFLDEIETVNGSVMISNMTNFTNASAVNGNIKALNLRGTAKISTVNGTTEASFDEIANSGQISLETVNGQVNLLIPSDADAVVKAETVSGNINNDFGMYVRKGQYVGKDLYSKIGNGELKIKLSSVNGGLNIRRKNDGKQTKQVTNLLNSKNNDEDWDDENSSSVSRTTSKSSVRNTASMPPIPPIPPIDVTIPPIEIDFPQITVDALVAAQKGLEIASKALRNAKVNKLSAAEIEVYQDAYKQAQEVLRNTQEELKIAQKEFNRERLEAARENAEKAREDVRRNLAMVNSDWSPNSVSIDKKSNTFTVKGTPKVTIEAKNCAVMVRGWDKSEVAYTITKISRDQNLNPIEFDVNNTDTEVLIKEVNSEKSEKGYKNNSYRVKIEIFVPKKSNLKILTDKEVRLEGVSGELDIKGNDEAINVRDSDGKLNIANVDGRVRVIGFKGELDAKTQDGEVFLEGVFEKINAIGNDSSFILTISDKTNADLSYTGESFSNENINLIGDTEKPNKKLRIGKGGAKYNFQTSAGSLLVRNTNFIN